MKSNTEQATRGIGNRGALLLRQRWCMLLAISAVLIICLNKKSTSSLAFSIRESRIVQRRTITRPNWGADSLHASSLRFIQTDNEESITVEDKTTTTTATLDRKRRLLVTAAGLSLLLTSLQSQSTSAEASAVRAPTELLRPATRVRLFIDGAIDLPITNDAVGLDKLQQYLENEPVFMTNEEEKLSKRYLEIDTSTTWQEARRKDREARGKEAGVDYTSPYDQVNTAIQQWGNRRQFQILRKRQLALEQASPVRAAFNCYTNNLVFGDSYQLNAEGDERKSLIRNNALPDVNAVVVSDLDLRDLYRNEVLERLEDARAEIAYQQTTGNVDVSEVVTSLKAAQASCRDWFSFIPADDVAEALRAVEAQDIG